MKEGAAAAAALKEEFRQQLIQERRALLRTLAMTEEEIATVDTPEPGGRAEGAAVDTTNSILSRLGARGRHELDEISDALSRLEAGSFGLCERCGLAIPLARLRAMPAARCCVDCQSREEKRR
jgi:DnaK suppressor protein